MRLAGSGHSREPGASARDAGGLQMKMLAAREGGIRSPATARASILADSDFGKGYQTCRGCPRQEGMAALSRDSESVRRHLPSRSRRSKTGQMRVQRSLQAPKLAIEAADGCSVAARDPRPPAGRQVSSRLSERRVPVSCPSAVRIVAFCGSESRITEKRWHGSARAQDLAPARA